MAADGGDAAQAEAVLRLLAEDDVHAALERLRTWHSALTPHASYGRLPTALPPLQHVFGAANAPAPSASSTTALRVSDQHASALRTALVERLLATPARDTERVHALTLALVIVAGARDAWPSYVQLRRRHIDEATEVADAHRKQRWAQHGSPAPTDALNNAVSALVDYERVLVRTAAADEPLLAAGGPFASALGARERAGAFGLARYTALAGAALDAILPAAAAEAGGAYAAAERTLRARRE